MKNIKLFLLLLILFSCCSKKDSYISEDGKARGTMIEYTEGKTVSEGDVKKFVTLLDVSPYCKHNVKLFYVTYRTEYLGKPINTSGLLFLPTDVSSVKLIAYLHGTQLPLKKVEEKQIPSYYTGDPTGEDEFKEVKNTGLAWASAGYAVFQPDYIGFAGTDDKEHPYLYYPELFKANIDGISAALSLIKQKGYTVSKDIFLGGWSQGGGAALSANKLIQDWNNGKPVSERINVIGTSCLSGPYNFFKSLTDVMKDKDKSNTVIYIQSWGVYAVNKFSGLKRPYDQIWKLPVYDQVSSVFLGSAIPKDVYTDYFIDGLLNESDTTIVNICKSNSFYSGWVPTGKVYLYYGTADDVVQPFNSMDAAEGLKNAISAAGGNPQNVKSFPLEGEDHESGLGLYIKGTLENFKTLE